MRQALIFCGKNATIIHRKGRCFAMLFLRKRLFLDTDAMAFARVKDILAQNGIKFEVKTTCSENVLSRKFNSAAVAHYRQAFSFSDVSNPTYIYYIYVKPSDFKKAKMLAFSKK